jgi:hypothetical protein
MLGGQGGLVNCNSDFKKIIIFYLYFSKIFSCQTLDPYQDADSLEMLDADPQPCF